MKPFAIDATPGEKALLLEERRESSPFYSSSPVYNVERNIHDDSADKYDNCDSRISWYLILSVLASMIYLFLLGYNTAVMNSPEAVVFPGHSTSQWSLAVSSFAIGGPVGAVFGGDLADSRGRKGMQASE